MLSLVRCKHIEFLDTKIQIIIETFPPSNLIFQSLLIPMPATQLQSFSVVNNDSVMFIVKRVKYTFCDNDPIPLREIVVRMLVA